VLCFLEDSNVHSHLRASLISTNSQASGSLLIESKIIYSYTRALAGTKIISESHVTN